MASKNRDDFSQKTKEALAKRVSYRCSNPKCRRNTIGPSEDCNNKSVNLGEAAHICAASPGGMRYDKTMTSKQRSDISNGIWLCRNCAALIDRDPAYTVKLLHEWKDEAEKNSRNTLYMQNNNKNALTDQEEKIVKKIMSVMESDNTQEIICNHDFRGDFQRNLLDPIFKLREDLKLPSQKINNSNLTPQIEQFIYLLDQLRYFIAYKGGPSKYGNGSFVIDFEKDQSQCNELCDNIWDCYKGIVETYNNL